VSELLIASLVRVINSSESWFNFPLVKALETYSETLFYNLLILLCQNYVSVTVHVQVTGAAFN
jgi:hypothetical protein